MPIIFSSEQDYQLFLKEHKNRGFYQTENYGFIKDKTDTEPVQRPLGILILSYLMVFQSLFIFYLLYSEVVPYFLTNTFITLYLEILIVLQFILPYGLLRGKTWAYMFSGIVFILMIPIGLVYLYYLTRPSVQAYFHIDS
jgi:hypothetical protein